jgi:hypothetical protein
LKVEFSMTHSNPIPGGATTVWSPAVGTATIVR